LQPIELLGSVEVLLDEAGRMVERVETLAEGKPRIFGEDRKRPEVVRVVWTGNGETPAGQVPAGVLELSFSEPMRAGSLGKARITLGGQEIAGEHGQLSQDGRRVVLAAALPAGQQLALRVEGLEDRSGNLMQPLEVSFTVADSAQYQVLYDAASPQVLAVLDEGEGVSVLFDEPVVPAAGMELASAISVSRAGAPVEGSTTRVSPWQLAWRPSQAGQSQWLLGGEYRVSVTGLVELGPEQKPVSTNVLPVTFTHLASGSEKILVASQPPETPPRASSAFGNTTLFQGRLWVPELGLYYYRARWYDPMLVNFIERDPAGYADSPSLMQAFRYDPVNRRDPFGLWSFDLAKVPGDPTWNQLYLQELTHVARRLLLDPLTKRYLRKRFGDAAANEAYLRQIASMGTPPRVVWDDDYLTKLSALGAWDDERRAIILKSRWLAYGSDPRSPCASLVTTTVSVHANPACELRVWADAAVLVHETIHFIDWDTDHQPSVDAVLDTRTGVGAIDTGGKWQYLLFGVFTIPDEQANENQEAAFYLGVRILMDDVLRALRKDDYEKRWQQVLEWIAREETRARGRGSGAK